MENNKLTIVITPRDRYSGLDSCVENIYKHTNINFTLIILDLGYPKKELDKIKKIIKEKENVLIFDYGLITPMEALEKVRGEIVTTYTVLIDNDSRVTSGWLPPLINAVNEKNVIVSPLTLEKKGVDEGGAIRNHLHTCDIRCVEYDKQQYLIEDKKYRRALVEELPKGVMETDTFELHCVLFSTDHLKNIEIPHMVVREHIDIGLQTRAMGKCIVVQPESVILFDNLNTRMNYTDMKFFFFRWQNKLSRESHALFEKRWRYKFYAENAMYVWAFRRKIFLLARFIGMPIWAANKTTTIAKRLFTKDWDPLEDPISASYILREKYENGVVPQIDHATKI